jgi:hypothetical protein
MLHVKLRLLLAGGVLALSFSTVKADLVVLTSGNASSSMQGQSFAFNLTGVGFDARSVIHSLTGRAPALSCFPCRAGTLISLSSTTGALDASDFSTGHITVDGVEYLIWPQLGPPPPLPYVQVFGILNIVSPSLIMPASTDAFVRLTMPFELTGGLNGRSREQPFFTFTVELFGRGVASMTFERIGFDANGNGIYKPQGSISYSFENPGPIPEPASMTLLVLGLTTIGGLVRARKRRHDCAAK